MGSIPGAQYERSSALEQVGCDRTAGLHGLGRRSPPTKRADKSATAAGRSEGRRAAAVYSAGSPLSIAGEPLSLGTPERAGALLIGDLELDAAILFAALFRLVVGDGL